jgi:transposase
MSQKSKNDEKPQNQQNQHQPPKKRRRRFSKEFKTAAVRLVLEEGRTMNSVAKDLGIDASVIGIWVKQARFDAGNGPAESMTTQEKEELVRLRKEIRVLKMEREILKKATVFFAKENA